MIARLSQVVPGLYRGGAPSIKDLSSLKKKYNINKIISLDLNEGKKIDRACKLLNIEHIMMPIMAKRFSALNKFPEMNWKDILLSNGPTFIHCLHGKDRTGLVVALFRVQQGWSVEQAIKEADKFGFCKGLPEKVREFYTSLINKASAASAASEASKARETDSNAAFDLLMNDSLVSDTILNPDHDYSYDQDNDVDRYQGVDADNEESSRGISSNNIPEVGILDANSFINGFGPTGGYL